MKTPEISRFRHLACALLPLALLTATTASAQPKPKLDPPTMTCAAATQTSIGVQVCAGATGAPAGFSLHWMTADAFAANGGVWPDSSDPSLCHASFSGNAHLSRYNLTPNQCVTVVLGDFLFDEGASTNCWDVLTCGTEYVMRGFAHATRDSMRSAFTENRACSTLGCGNDGGCTLTQGFWKTHYPEAWPQAVQVGGLVLGNVAYSASELEDIFNKPAQGNGLVALAHQLIAAKINVASGADGTAALAAIAAADGLIGDLVVPPVGTGFLHPSLTSALTTSLDSFNGGAIGPGHCGG